jgi:hypothetical protein
VRVPRRGWGASDDMGCVCGWPWIPEDTRFGSVSVRVPRRWGGGGGARTKGCPCVSQAGGTWDVAGGERSLGGQVACAWRARMCVPVAVNEY